ncbi:interleukin-1 receptor-associated kinase 1 [Plakobranchus ocellatus]|uniref:non-specific serine/threonine protein kinase n=1 Tax=Plakobranchus ocellatus TaxID=259542 RepID=A0AAV3XVY8_9GAST|nr:interleukin-1 receptor-associated kinase 1 [Plakobranchus ocellatus]
MSVLIFVLASAAKKYKQQPLSSLLADAEQRSQVAEGEKAVAAAAKNSLDSLLSQVKIPGSSVAGSKSSIPSFGHESSIGCAVNFNNSQAQYRADPRQLQKTYGEKIIPWAEPVPGMNSPESILGLFPTKSGNSSVHQATESVDPHSDIAELSSFSKTSSSMYSGVNALNQMLNLSSSAGVPHSNAGPTVGAEAPDHNTPEMTLKTSFKYKELCDATNNFSESNLIGQGAFGKVYKGTLRQLDCAIKRLIPSEMEHTTDMTQFMSELSKLARFSHENIVVLYGYALEDGELCLVYQHLINGSLEDRLMLKGGTSPLTWRQRLNILLGACKGLNFLHTFREKPLIHADIKSANILLDRNWEAKIADLGQALYATGVSNDTRGYTHVSVVQTKTKIFGTKAYHAPEVLRSGQLSTKSDVFAMGVVFLETCSGLQAYDPNRSMNQFLAHFFSELEEDKWISRFQDKHLETVPESSFKQVLTLANKCVLESKAKRPKTNKLLEGIQACYDMYGPATSSTSEVGHQHMMDLQKKISETTFAESGSVSTYTSLPSVPGSRIAAEQEEILRQNHSAVYHSVHDLQQGLQQAFHPSDVASSNNSQPGCHEFDTRMLVQSCNSPQPGLGEVSLSKLQQGQQMQNVTDVSSQPSLTKPSSPRVAQNPQETSSLASDSSRASLEVLYGGSLPLRLQQAYDRAQANKKLRQEGYYDPNSLSLELLSQESGDFRQKLLAENGSGQSHQAQHTESTQHLGPPVEDDFFPKPDPKKLQELYAFDNANFPGSNSNSNQKVNSETIQQCDPRKIAYMKQFDENSFKTLANNQSQVDSTCKPSPSISSQGVESHNVIPRYRLPLNPGTRSNMCYSPAMYGYGNPHLNLQGQYVCYRYPQQLVAEVSPSLAGNPSAMVAHSSMSLRGKEPSDQIVNETQAQKATFDAQAVTYAPEQTSLRTEDDINNRLVSDSYYAHVADQYLQEMVNKNLKKTDLDSLMAEISDENF